MATLPTHERQVASSPFETSPSSLDIPVLIIGTGPAGASLAAFLGSHGITGLMVTKSPGTSATPRAHITNMAAFECLRDIGLEEECLKLATSPDHMRHTRWCHSMAGVEYARIYSWGGDPHRHGDLDVASPCTARDLPQSLLEPVLVKYATQHGFNCRFDTEFIDFRDDGVAVTTTLKDRITQQTYTVKSRFLFGADGGRSKVFDLLEIPMIKQPGGGLAINVLLKADLSHLMPNRIGNLHWTIQPDVEHPWYAWSCVVRMVKPWHEWVFIIFPDPVKDHDVPLPDLNSEEWLHQCRRFIGDPDIPASVVEVSKWYVNEMFAESYSHGNVFCLGDAVHRHPPFNGLGSNTCIQDSFNLAWKVAYVLNNRADRSLLDTYSQERQPVGKTVVRRANDGFREHHNIWVALGALKPTLEERTRELHELYEETEGGRERREHLKRAVKLTEHEFHAIGVEMNQEYVSEAVYDKDETVKEEVAKLTKNPTLYYAPSTYPGRRLPHAWISKSAPSELLSTIDLVGKGGFTILTGIGGSAWKTAAATVAQRLGVTIKAFSIGFAQDYHDVYSEWADRRAVQEDGCVLVRPDRFVAWRAMSMVENPEGKLLEVMEAILCRT